MCVTITTTENQIKVDSPYHSDFPSRAKKLGGRWISKQWVFNRKNETMVRDLCLEIYGTDGTPGKTVDIEVTFKEYHDSHDCSLFLCGRQIGRVFGRDSGAKLGDNVVILEGNIGSSGSRKNPTIYVKGGTKIIMRDLPEKAVKEAQKDNEYDADIKVIATDIDIEALKEERERLLLRVAEINSMIRLLDDVNELGGES